MSDIDRVVQLVDRLGSLLHGNPSFVQGAVLADLVAIWIAGHMVEGSAEQTDELRARLLRDHIDAVRNLVPENAKAIGTYQP